VKRRFYLAYGSNLNIEQMRFRCETAKPAGKTVLEGYRLTFRGGDGAAVANIEPEDGAVVPCGLWLISPEDEQSLDRYEGFPHLYRKETVKVCLGKRKLSVMAYVMNAGYPIGMPGMHYLCTIFDGYSDFELDDAALIEAVELSVVREPHSRF
jgi:gamma-glutamylcyclotransferase (GGCT)/AIG2-like uncharacterized protein YtfP